MLRFLSNRRFATVNDFQFPASAQQWTGVPAIAALPDGGFVTIWTRSISGTLHNVGQMYDRNGRATGSEFVVGPGGGANVSALPGGGFVVTWEAASGVGQGRIFDASGTAVGTQFTANTSGTAGSIQVAALAGGGFVLIWEDSFASNFDNIRGHVFTANGTKLGSQFNAGDNVLGTEVSSEIVALTGGGFVVAWTQTGGDSSFGNGSRAQVFDAAGNKLGAAFTLNTITPGSQQSPKLAALANGGFAAVWLDDGTTQSGNPNNGNQGVWAQLFDATGNKVGDDIFVDAGSDLTDVTAIPGIGFAVIWKELSDPSSDSYGRLHIQIFDFDGQRIGEEIMAAPHLNSIQNRPELTVLAGGALMVSWQDWVPQANQEFGRATILFPTTQGTAGADSMTGTANRDFLHGLDGDDQLAGGGEDDGLNGGNGNDVLDGGTGNDILVGGIGADRLTGGAGADIFQFDTAGETVGFLQRSDGKQVKYDVIADFTHGADKIDLSPIDANVGTTANQAFTLIGDAPFSGEAGQLRIVTVGDKTTIFGDTDGDRQADFQITVLTSVPLTATDFFL